MLADDLHLIQGAAKAGRPLSAVLHTERGINGDNDPGPSFAGEPTGRPTLRGRSGEGQHQKEKSQAAQKQKKDVTQTQLPRADAYVTVEKLHRRPIGALDLLAVEQMREDRQAHPDRSEQQQWI